MAPFETIYIDEMVVACNGGSGALGHPLVYLNLAPAGKIECPYCSRLFVNRATPALGGEPGSASGPAPAEAGGETTPPSSEPQPRNI